MSIKLSPTAIIREAKRIKTTPSVLATRALKFKGKPDCERLVRFIKSSGEELSKVSIPNSKSLVKGMGGGGKDGGLGDIASNDLLMNALTAAMFPAQSATGALIGGGLGLGVGALGLGALGLGGGKMMKGTRNILSKGINKTKKVATKVTSKISNAGKGVKNFFGKSKGVADDAVEAVAKKTAKKVGPKVAAKTAKATTSKAMGALPLIGNLWDLGSAAYRFSKGDTVGGLLSLGSAIPIAGWGFAAIDIARDGGAFEKTPLKSKKDEEKEEKKDDNEVKKSVEQDKEPDKLNRVVDKFDSVVNKYSVKGKSFGVISKAKKWFGFSKGGKVPGSGNRDTVPAMLTPGEVVMNKSAVDKIGADNLLALNSAGGGTNKPTLMSEKLGHTRGVVTDPERKKKEEEYMLHWVNKERVEFLGLPPLNKLSYADGVELTKEMGAGPKVREESSTDLDFDNMIKTTSRSKTVGDKTIFKGSVGLLTEEDKKQYLASNPQARMMMELKDQFELDALGADISASARMNGGGLVQGLNGGGLVADTRTLGPNSPLPSPGWGRKGGFTPTPMWQKPSPSGGSGSWGTSIKLAKQNRPVGTIENEGVIINNIPSPQPVQQGGGSQIIPVPVGGGSQPQSSPPMPSYFQIVNSIRISSLLTKLSIT